jgi:LytS/YehU family sensor histidine kinase
MRTEEIVSFPARAAGTRLGFLIAPAIPGAVVAIGERILGVSDGLTLGGLLAYGYLVSAILTGLIAAPLFVLFRRRGWIRWWSAAAVGALIGLGLVVLLRLPNPPEAQNFLLYVPAGGLAGLGFWGIRALAGR